VDWRELVIDIDDLLFTQLKLTVFERALYINLLRRTHAVGVSTVVVSLPELGTALGISEWKARDIVRKLADKGAIRIEKRNRKGHEIRTMLPTELGLERLEPEVERRDLESIDFFSNRSYKSALVEREGSKRLSSKLDSTCQAA